MSGCFDQHLSPASINRPGDLAPAPGGANGRAVRACTTMPAVPAPILRGTSSSKFARPWLSKCSQNEPSGCQAVVRVPFLLQMEGASADNQGRTYRLGSDRGSLNHSEHAVVEAGDAADPIVGEGEDEEAGPVAEAGMVA